MYCGTAGPFFHGHTRLHPEGRGLACEMVVVTNRESRTQTPSVAAAAAASRRTPTMHLFARALGSIYLSPPLITFADGQRSARSVLVELARTVSQREGH